MNNEHIKIIETLKESLLHPIVCNNDKYKYAFPFFNDVIYYNEINKIKHIIEKFEEFMNAIDDNNDELLEAYVKNNKVYVKIRFNDNTFYDTTLFGYIRTRNKSKAFNNIAKENGHEVLSLYKTAKENILIDFKCGHPPHYMTPNSYLSGSRCPICAKNTIMPYVNDLYTLRPDLLKYFKNENDAVGLATYSKKIIELKCPICGSVKITKPLHIATDGFSCNFCGDGRSYPEKMMTAIFDLLYIEYDTQVYFDWCKYIVAGKEHYGIYDFVIYDKQLIIELDGLQHYESGHFNNNFLKNKDIDNIKDNLALANGFNVIRINCSYYRVYERFEIIKNNIIQELNDYFDFSEIDWDEIATRCTDSKVKLVCDLWNQGYSNNAICQIAKSNMTSVIHYLMCGTELNMCDYSKDESLYRKGRLLSSKSFKYIKVSNKENDIVGVFWDKNIFIEEYEKSTGIKLNKTGLTYAIKNTPAKYKKLYFQEISKDEYIKLCENYNLITDNRAGIDSILYIENQLYYPNNKNEVIA